MDFGDLFGPSTGSTTENGSSLVDLLDSFLEMPVAGSQKLAIVPEKKSPKKPPKKPPRPKKVKKAKTKKTVTKIKEEPIQTLEVSDDDQDAGDDWMKNDDLSEDEWPLEPDEALFQLDQKNTKPETKAPPTPPPFLKEETPEPYDEPIITNANFQHLLDSALDDAVKDEDSNDNHFNDFFNDSSGFSDYEGQKNSYNKAEERAEFIKKLQKSRSLTCNFCGQTFVSCDKRLAHELRVHVKDDFRGPYPEVNLQRQTLEFLDFSRKRADSESVECCFCRQKFSTSFNRFRHEKVAHLQSLSGEVSFPQGKNLNYECELCARRWETKRQLKEHLQRHFPDLTIDIAENDDLNLCQARKASKSLHCYFCSLKFRKPQRRFLHERNIHFGQAMHAVADGAYSKCKLCGFRSETLRAVQIHIKRKHNETTKLGLLEISAEKRDLEVQESQERSGAECKFCKKTFSDKYKRVSHEMKVHLGAKKEVPDYAELIEGKYHCKECEYAVPALSTIRKHYEALHSPVQPNKLSMVVNVKQHYQTEVFMDTEEDRIKIEAAINNDALVCVICMATFENRSSRVLHQCERHFDTRWRCLHCTNVFHPKHNLRRHLETAHANLIQSNTKPAPESIFCSICGKNFNSMREVRMHEARVHISKADPKFKCPLCGVRKITDGEVRRHIRVHHIEQTVKCPECQAICYTTDELLSHKCTPENACDKCELSFPNEKKLRRHQTKCKTEYLCTEPGCNSKFPHISGLNRHVRRHQWHRGEIEVANCQYCGHRFFDKSHLASHMKTHRIVD